MWVPRKVCCGSFLLLIFSKMLVALFSKPCIQVGVAKCLVSPVWTWGSLRMARGLPHLKGCYQLREAKGHNPFPWKGMDLLPPTLSNTRSSVWQINDRN